MRIIVCPHDMSIGGSQLNALDLAAAARDRGHQVILYAAPGPLMDRARDLGLEVALTDTGLRLSARWAADLMRLVRSWRADVVHTYEWAPAMGASFGAHGFLGVPQVMTVLSMDVPRFLPRHLDLIVGTRELWTALDTHSHRHLIEPPIDTVADAPTPAGPARRALGLGAEEIVLAVVGRMTTDLDKAAGVLAAVRAVDRLAERIPTVLLAVGDGPELDRITAAARRVNDRHGRLVVGCPGAFPDPAPAYAAADIVLGMGSSVLRGMAFAKPAIVLGAAGFCRPVTAGTADSFGWQGFYGTGDGGDYLLLPLLEDLVGDAAERRRRGDQARRLVEERYSLVGAAERLEAIYARAVGRRGSLAARTVSLARSAAGLGSFLAGRNRDRSAAA